MHLVNTVGPGGLQQHGKVLPIQLCLACMVPAVECTSAAGGRARCSTCPMTLSCLPQARLQQALADELQARPGSPDTLLCFLEALPPSVPPARHTIIPQSPPSSSGCDRIVKDLPPAYRSGLRHPPGATTTTSFGMQAWSARSTATISPRLGGWTSTACWRTSR